MLHSNLQILEKKTKNVLENGWWIRALVSKAVVFLSRKKSELCSYGLILVNIVTKREKLCLFPHTVFVAIVEDNATMSSIPYFENRVSYFVQLKEVDPIKLISLRQISLSIALKNIINNSVWKKTEPGHRWLQLFLFSLKMSVTAISFYWRNDTRSFVTWRRRLATTPDTPTNLRV